MNSLTWKKFVSSVEREELEPEASFLLKVLNDTTCTTQIRVKNKRKKFICFDRDGFYSLYVFEAGSNSISQKLLFKYIGSVIPSFASVQQRGMQDARFVWFPELALSRKEFMLHSKVWTRSKQANLCCLCCSTKFKKRLCEDHLDQVLSEEFGTHLFTKNKRVDGGKSRRRPDWFVRGVFCNLVLELDEFQHRTRAQDLENIRLYEIHHDFNDTKPTVVIRINLDGYVDLLGKRHGTCFDKTTSTLNEDEFKRRFSVIRSHIAKWLFAGDRPTSDLHIIRLFFDRCMY